MGYAVVVARTYAVGRESNTVKFSDAMVTPRRIAQRIVSREQGEGVGARVRRSIGSPMLRNLDPFLMLDEFKVAAPAGFPDHPHRGFSTVTLMLSGSILHEDFAGHRGVIRAGDLQWMCAGRGIVHSEMPAGDDGVSHGLQLWVNLQAKDKLVMPDYQELMSDDVPVAKDERTGVHVRVIAGSSLGVSSAIRTRTPVSFLQVRLAPGAELAQQVPSEWTCFVYVLAGSEITTDDTRVAPHHTIVFAMDGGDGIVVSNDATNIEDAHFVIIAGQPIGEPVVQHGPFVMNTHEEILTAINDYSSGRNGFERARRWQSESGKSLR